MKFAQINAIPGTGQDEPIQQLFKKWRPQFDKFEARETYPARIEYDTRE